MSIRCEKEIMSMFLKTIAVLCLANLASSQPNTTEIFEHNAVLDNGEVMHLYWKFNETYISFEIHGNTTGWVGVGISPGGSMANSDIYVGWVKNGIPTITDRHGLETNGLPPLDTIGNVELLEGFEQDGWTVIKFRRLLVTCDSEDLDITADTLRVIFAWKSDDPSGDDLADGDYHGLTRGVKSLMLLEPTRTDENMFPEGETHFTYDLVNDNMHVPAADTYYNCRLLKMPELPTKHHLVKIEPIIHPGHELNVHHMLVYQCTDEANITSVDVDHECYQSNMPPEYQSCQFVVVAWAIGGAAFYYPKHTGFPLGVPGAPKYVVLEMHYDNPAIKSDIVDSSGLRLYYTPDLRVYDAGIMEVGHIVNGYGDIIPPHTESFLDLGQCSSNCLSNHIRAQGHESINVFGVVMHSHLLCNELTLQHVRNGTELPNLAKDSSYDFNFQEARFLPEERLIVPGDTMQMVCNYNSLERTDITMGGLSTKEEMCLAFVYYYPKLPLTFCQSAPNYYSMMTYFGITDYEYTESDGLPNLHDIFVTSPLEHANKTAYEVVNSHHWDQESADEFNAAVNSMIQQQVCYAPGPAIPGIRPLIPPLNINIPYVPLKNNCSDSSSTTDLAHTTSDRPPTTTPLGAVETTSAAAMISGATFFMLLCPLGLAKLMFA